MTAYQQVLAARAPRPYTTRTLIAGLVQDFQACHGDRVHGDDPAIIGGIGWLNDQPVTVIATTKGETLPERLATHGGCPEPWGYRKALRLMRQAEKFHRPIITLIDTPGAYPGKEAEDNGQAAAIADLLLAASTLATPLVSVLVGEGGSGGALALACGDEVWMSTNSMYAILSPEGFASILFRDVSRAEEAADLMKLTPDDLLAAGVVEKIVPDSGVGFGAALKAALLPTIQRLNATPLPQLLAQRQARFRRF
ncbi:MAG: acetyl-CoA carboxylase carboxyl transferase subunit alpha [Lactobacillus sp.]|jgi:acetyl-CoA carboxylase carboxyl transferase subunit alpha|nr:acetyl-CoA carboxylase carboxyl transferase subunit alpha [Lactobacillus sp.]MCI2034140.1 acetyl-CoA carboxylase carboxyl transferase subunit alpha [Lactobacillus sp.]